MPAASFPDRDLMSEMTARMLLEVDAVHFRPEEPFIFSSGLASPVYIDCRKLISYPRLRGGLIDFCASVVLREVGFERIDTVAGGETAGIPFAAWLAERLQLPMNYIRKQPKGFGRDAQIEGAAVAGKRALLVEDLATNGGSKLNFCEALRGAGAEVSHAVVIFFYDIYPDSRRTLADAGLELHYLATWRDVLAAARMDGRFDGASLAEVERFLADPIGWSVAHGGIGAPPAETGGS